MCSKAEALIEGPDVSYLKTCAPNNVHPSVPKIFIHVCAPSKDGLAVKSHIPNYPKISGNSHQVFGQIS